MRREARRAHPRHGNRPEEAWHPRKHAAPFRDHTLLRLWRASVDASAGLRVGPTAAGAACGGPLPLIELPRRFTELYAVLGGCTCAQTKQFPEEPAICLLCGETLCAGSNCCKENGVGALTRHASLCGAGTGLFLLVHKCATVVVRGSYAAYSISPYVDAHGEEDSGLKRGRPLTLDRGRVRHLWRMLASHAVAGEVVRERMVRDRVIRENYY